MQERRKAGDELNWSSVSNAEQYTDRRSPTTVTASSDLHLSFGGICRTSYRELMKGAARTFQPVCDEHLEKRQTQPEAKYLVNQSNTTGAYSKSNSFITCEVILCKYNCNLHG